jgi:Leucine-rich repeat (LRR) protein
MYSSNSAFYVKKTSDYIPNFSDIKIPTGTTNIVASGIGLKSLYGLPEGIISLDVSDNELTSLEYCPKSLKNLRASKNKISSLFGIENIGIEKLGISYNHLTSFEYAPKTLLSVVGVSNFLTTLKGLSSDNIMEKLYVSYNKLTDLLHCPVAEILDVSCNLRIFRRNPRRCQRVNHIKQSTKGKIIKRCRVDH